MTSLQMPKLPHLSEYKDTHHEHGHNEQQRPCNRSKPPTDEVSKGKDMG